MRVLPLSSRSQNNDPGGRNHLGVAAELAQVGRLQRDLERAQANYEREIAELGTSTRRPASHRFASAPSRSACLEDLLDLGLSRNQARRVLEYLEERGVARLQDA